MWEVLRRVGGSVGGAGDSRLYLGGVNDVLSCVDHGM